jgi:hypothetical protein
MRVINLSAYHAKLAAYSVGLRVQFVEEPDPLKWLTMNDRFYEKIKRLKKHRAAHGITPEDTQ